MIENSVKMLLLTSACMAHAMYGMQLDKFCFFTLLPTEIRNNIVRYLDFYENDKEFIARTYREISFSPEHQQLVDKVFAYGRHVNEIISACPKIRCYSSGGTKIVGLQIMNNLLHVSRYFHIAAIDTKTGTFCNVMALQEVLHRRRLDFGTIHCIALSHNQKRLVLLETCYTDCTKERAVTPKYLHTIHVNGSGALSRLPDDYDHSDFISIDFNKQETKLIGHTCSGDYHIEPLATPEVDKAREKCTFDEYLYMRAICKPLPHVRSPIRY